MIDFFIDNAVSNIFYTYPEFRLLGLVFQEFVVFIIWRCNVKHLLLANFIVNEQVALAKKMRSIERTIDNKND